MFKKRGMHSKKQSTGFKPRSILLPMALVLVLGGVGYAGVTATTALLQKDAQQTVTNTFVVSTEPGVDVTEDFDGETKSDVAIEVTGTTPCLVRVGVTFTLLDDNDQIVPTTPVAGTDYSITYGTSWTQGADGYWYCNSIVAGGGTSPVLISECTTLNTQYKLDVKILAQCIQAAPADAVEDAWGMSYSNGSWEVA